MAGALALGALGIGAATATPASASTPTIAQVLGAAGPASDAAPLALVGLSGDAATRTLDCGNAQVDGNVALAGAGSFRKVAACDHLGTVYETPQVTNSVTPAKAAVAVEVDDALMADVRNAAFAANTTFAGLAPTDSVPGGAITGSATLTGTAGLNVVEISHFDLRGGTVTLDGPAGTQWVVNVTGRWNLGAGSIVLGPDLTANDVVFNITEPGTPVGFSTRATGAGIFLAPYAGWDVLGDWTGELIGGRTLRLMAGTHLTAGPALPPPSSTGDIEVCNEAADVFIPVGTNVDYVVAGEVVTVPVGACVDVTEVPSGAATVQQLSNPAASLQGILVDPDGRLVSQSFDDASVTVTVVPSSTTTVTFLNGGWSPDT